MKLAKSLMLCSVAGLLATGGAQAADLPIKAKAVEYVRVCSLYGAGFWYIPGTDTCIKLGGYLRVETSFNANGLYNGNYSGVQGATGSRFQNDYFTRSREDLNIDTRTATEYGVVRTFFDATFSWTTDVYTGGSAGATVYSQLGSTGVSAPNNANAGAIAGGTVGVYYAFIQFAGFTMGKAVSQFDAPWQNYPGNNFDGLVGGGGTVTGVNQLSYTADFGQGISATISAQDPTAYGQSNLFNLGVPISGATFTGASFGSNDFGGTRAPDIIGMVRVDQAWGLFQFSAAAHNNHAGYYATPGTIGGVAVAGTELAGHPEDKWGWAAQAALSIKNIPTGPGDTINVQAVYTDGATRYNFQSLAAQNYSIFGGSGTSYQSIGLAAAADGVFGTGTGISTVQTWGMRGAYTHNWDAYWNTAIYGAYAQLHYGNGGTALVCAQIAATPGIALAVGGCNPDFNIAQLGLITRWTPVKNLTFSGEVTWTHLDQKFTGTVTPGAASLSLGKPGGVSYELKDQDTVGFLARAQRNF